MRRRSSATAAGPASANASAVGEDFLTSTRSSRYSLPERNKSETAAPYCFMSVMFCCTQYDRKYGLGTIFSRFKTMRRSPAGPAVSRDWDHHGSASMERSLLPAMKCREPDL